MPHLHRLDHLRNAPLKKIRQRNRFAVTVIWNRWRSQLFSWHPNILDFGPAGAWPFWQLRVLIFYAVTLAGWIAYLYAFVWLHRRMDRV